MRRYREYDPARYRSRAEFIKAWSDAAFRRETIVFRSGVVFLAIAMVSLATGLLFIHDDNLLLASGGLVIAAVLHLFFIPKGPTVDDT